VSIPHFPGWTSGRLSPRTIALAVGRGVLGLLVLIALVASGCDRDPTETAPEAPASSPSVQPAPSTRTPKLARVPAVEGLGLANAKRKLRAAGLEVGEVDRRPSTKRKDTVLKQGVAKGTELEPGSSVPLVVAAPLPRVPSVIGKPEASAIRTLKKCWLQGQDDNADHDQRSGRGGTQSVTHRRNTGQAELSRWHCDFECAT
jgi:hypothetical protein